MAKRRMLSIELCNSDGFLNLTNEARLLYFYINLSADDDGFTSKVKSLTRYLDLSESYLEELCEKNYLIKFPGGTYVVRHWYVHNQIPKDRHTPTDYIEEFKMLELVNKIYVLKEKNEEEKSSVFFGNILYTQISSDERSEDELKEEKKRENKNNSDQRRLSGENGTSSTNVENFVENFR